ncbi:MAG: 4-hydroxy-tetrahydrodipicolinate reductase [Roseivirga sp.]|nr:4-hydroxy-tetrahydrodipicolinate reductase [Roseivirga sp.]
MRLLLLGYGKMGQMIDQMATSKGHDIVARINIDNRAELETLDTSSIDAAIDFSQPQAAVNNIKWCIDHQIPVAVGTTGWLDQKAVLDAYCTEKQGTYLYSSNFSIGVNIFFKVNSFLAGLMDGQKDYDVSMNEIHHTQKLDAPSGTAITLAEGIIENLSRKDSWVNDSKARENELLISSERIDPTPGTHAISYNSPIDSIDIRHTAHGREGFASGAIFVAEWIVNQRGVLTMDDFLSF